MNKQEKTLLLQLILEDVQGNWGWESKPRVPMALKLATELDLQAHIERIKNYQSFEEIDGRHFRTHYEYGGYEEMEELHGLDKSVKGKSEEFLNLCDEYLTHPDYRFDDWNER